MKTKRTLKALYIFALLAFLCVGCAHRVCAPFTTIHTTDTITLCTTDTITICTTDTITKAAKDSALLCLLAECDSNNNVILSELACMQGERNKIKYNTYNNRIAIQSECDSLMTIYERQIKEIYERQLKEIRDKQEYTKVIIERPSLKEQISNVVFLFSCGFIFGMIFFIIIFRRKIFTF